MLKIIFPPAGVSPPRTENKPNSEESGVEEGDELSNEFSDEYDPHFPELVQDPPKISGRVFLVLKISKLDETKKKYKDKRNQESFLKTQKSLLVQKKKETLPFAKRFLDSTREAGSPKLLTFQGSRSLTTNWCTSVSKRPVP